MMVRKILMVGVLLIPFAATQSIAQVEPSGDLTAWMSMCEEKSPPFSKGDIIASRQCNAILKAANVRFSERFVFSINPYQCGTAGRSIYNQHNTSPSGEERTMAYGCLYAYHQVRRACGFDTPIKAILTALASREDIGEMDAVAGLYDHLVQARNDVACEQAIRDFNQEYEQFNTSE